MLGLAVLAVLAVLANEWNPRKIRIHFPGGAISAIPLQESEARLI